MLNGIGNRVRLGLPLVHDGGAMAQWAALAVAGRDGAADLASVSEIGAFGKKQIGSGLRSNSIRSNFTNC